MREALRRVWCALRRHPYPLIWNKEAQQGWLEGTEPVRPPVYCSNCNAEIRQHRGGMGS